MVILLPREWRASEVLPLKKKGGGEGGCEVVLTRELEGGGAVPKSFHP